MSPRHLTNLYRPACLLVASSALVLFAGSDFSSAGIQGTGRMALASVGPITSTGDGNTLSVNGITYGLSKAKIKVDGHSAKASQLQVGQIVTVQGALDGPGKADASTVTFNGNVVGPVTHVDATAGTFTVLGQTVVVDADTLFGEGIQPAGIGALRVGTGVEVSAFPNASGQLLASRIDLQSAGSPLQVQGMVQALDRAAQTFQINSLAIDYGQATVAGALANASTATVSATEYPNAGTLHAASVEVSNGIGAAAGVHGLVEGLITSFQSAGSFYVGDQLVVTNRATYFVLHGSTLAPNVAVMVIGTFDSRGALVANQLRVEPRAP
jgi:Domain of unknown function (DUF5666)